MTTAHTQADAARAFRNMPNSLYADVMNGRKTAEEAIAAQLEAERVPFIHPELILWRADVETERHPALSTPPFQCLDVDDPLEAGLTLGTFGFTLTVRPDAPPAVNVTLPNLDQLGTLTTWDGTRYALVPMHNEATENAR